MSFAFGFMKSRFRFAQIRHVAVAAVGIGANRQTEVTDLEAGRPPGHARSLEGNGFRPNDHSSDRRPERPLSRLTTGRSIDSVVSIELMARFVRIGFHSPASLDLTLI